MKWILIALIYSGQNNGWAHRPMSVEFESEKACINAADKVRESLRGQSWIRPDWTVTVCVPKDVPLNLPR